MGKINIGPSTTIPFSAVSLDEAPESVIEPSIFQPEVQLIEKTIEIHHHHETKVEYNPEQLFTKLEQNKEELFKRIDLIQNLLNSEIIKKEALVIQLNLQKEHSNDLRALIQELDVKLQLHEPRISEVEQRKVTEIIRVHEKTPKGLMYLTVFNFILALIGLLT